MTRGLKKEFQSNYGAQIGSQEKKPIDALKDSNKNDPVDRVSVFAPLRMNSVTADRDSFHNIRVSQQSYGNMATLRSQSISEIVQPGIQRKPADESDETYSDASPATAEQSLTPSEQTQVSTPGLIVDDSTTEPAPGQMRKTEFLSQLRASVCATAEAALSGTIWSSVGCPWIDHWLGYYGGRSARHIEQAIHKYAGETSPITSAGDYITLICGRVRRSIETWSSTGEVAGVPEGVPVSLPEINVGTIFSRIGRLLFKANENVPEGTVDPGTVQSQLSPGRPLDSKVRSRMEPAFGRDFSGVRIHTEKKDTRLSDNLNARAFTLGRDIAFGEGEYQPGTIVGDALIAHELAHVTQQEGGSVSSGLMSKNGIRSGSLEEEADHSAISVISSMWGGFTRKTLPQLKSGLRLQRCIKKREKKAWKPPSAADSYEEWLASQPEAQKGNITDQMPDDLKALISGDSLPGYGHKPDCADVAIILRHYYLTQKKISYSFVAGREKLKFKIGYGVSNSDLKTVLQQIGAVNIAEPKGRAQAVLDFEQYGVKPDAKKLKPGHIILWKYIHLVTGKVRDVGHSQTVQKVDHEKQMIYVVQGSMEEGEGLGKIEAKSYTFKEFEKLHGKTVTFQGIKFRMEFVGSGGWKKTPEEKTAENEKAAKRGDLKTGGLAASSAVSTWDANVRLEHYHKPAELLSKRVLEDLESGDITKKHMDARMRAYLGRNRLLEETRKKLSPGGRALSKAMKEEGRSIKFITRKYVTEVLKRNPNLMSAFGLETVDPGSKLYNPVRFEAAYRKLAKHAEVSKEIIKAAGRTSEAFTLAAKVTRITGPIGMAIAAANSAYEIVSASEEDRLKVIGRETAGVIGGTVGTVGGGLLAGWTASLICGPIAPLCGILVSLLVVGGSSYLGSLAGEELYESITEDE